MEEYSEFGQFKELLDRKQALQLSRVGQQLSSILPVATVDRSETREIGDDKKGEETNEREKKINKANKSRLGEEKDPEYLDLPLKLGLTRIHKGEDRLLEPISQRQYEETLDNLEHQDALGSCGSSLEPTFDLRSKIRRGIGRNVSRRLGMKRKPRRNLEEVTCFRCWQMGHFADRCTEVRFLLFEIVCVSMFEIMSIFV